MISQEIINQIRKTAHPTYKLDRAITFVERYENGETIRKLAAEIDISIVEAYNIVKNFRKKVAQAEKELAEGGDQSQ